MSNNAAGDMRHRIMVLPNKLGDDNYRSWALQCYNALESLGLNQHVDGDAQPVKPQAGDADEWKRQGTDAKAQIIQNIGANQTEYLDPSSSAWKIWNDLKSAYAPADAARRFDLENKLHNTKMVEGSNVVEHFETMYRLYREYKQAGGSMEISSFNSRVIWSLPESFRGLIDVLTVSGEIETIPPLQLKQRLTSFANSHPVTPPVPVIGAYAANGPAFAGNMVFTGYNKGKVNVADSATWPASPETLCWDCMKDGHARGTQACEQNGIRTHFWGTNYARRGGRGGAASGGTGRNANTNNSVGGSPNVAPAANLASAMASASISEVSTDSDAPQFAQAHLAAAPHFAFATSVKPFTIIADDPEPGTNRTLKPDANEVSALLSVTPSTATKIVDHYLDSGCSQHMTPIRESFVKYTKLKVSVGIELADGNIVPAIGFGTIIIPAIVNDEIQWVSISEVLHVPHLAKALISVSQLGKKGLNVVLGAAKGLVTLSNGTIVLQAICEQGLYRVDIDRELYIANGLAHRCNAASTETAMLWHRRFAHLGERNLHKLAYRSLLDGIPGGKWEPLDKCEVCAREKTI